MTAPAHTTPALARVLADAGFEVADKPAGSALIGGAPSDWWDLADADLAVVARVVVTVDDGVEMFAFSGGRAMLLAWSARFSGQVPPLVLAEGVAALKGWALATEAVDRLAREGYPASDWAVGVQGLYPKARRGALADFGRDFG